MPNMWKVDQILQLFAPFECLGCHREGGLLCHQCGIEAIEVAPGCCYRCLRPTPSALCDDCRDRTRLCDVQVASSYTNLSVQLISRLKFARTQAAAQLIAKIMDNRLPPSAVDTIVVHVPTATQRVRQRGYDQAQLIAREFARYRRLPCQALLRRQGHSRQLGAGRQERRQQLEGAFYCPVPSKVSGRRILLIDDVLTTGATVEVAAKVLESAGAKEVSAALFAQKI